MTIRNQSQSAPQVGGEDRVTDLTLAVVNATRGCVLLLDGGLRVIATSAAFRQTFDVDAQAVEGQVVFSLGAGAWDIPQLRRLLDAASRQAADPEAAAFDLARRGRGPRRLVGHAERLASWDGTGARLLLTLSDVTEPHGSPTSRSEFGAADSLLLKEARHRISNGLQIVAAVLVQSARMTEAADARGHLQAAYGRVMAVAALERQLAYASEETVALQDYLTDLCQHMNAAAIGDPSRISLRSFVDAVEVSARTAASLGMIVTELVINAIKHAFPNERRGNVTITFDAQGESWVLSVADNGVGMPEGAPEGGLGTEIVNALARQLRAKVEVSDAFPGKVTSVRYRDAAAERASAT